MGRKKQTPERRRLEASVAHEPAGDLLAPLLKVAVAGLVVVRLLVPAEASVQGETLWIVQLWLGVAVLWVWNAWRRGTFAPRFSWLDAAVWVLVAGHVLSAGAVLVTAGDKRAALNMLWEWVGIGVAFSLIRQLVDTRDESRRLAFVLLATTTVFAGLGIWQHFVWYPTADREYRVLREELDRLEHSGLALSAGQSQRVAELQRQLTMQGIPLEGPGREMWENRLSASTEPFGTFALANTFAGLLAVGVFLATGFLASQVAQRKAEHGTWALVATAVALLLLAYCLVLTKSRTAFVGVTAGAVVWAGLWLRGGRELSPRWRRAAIGLMAAVVVLAGAATFSGGLDRQVISEAPRSLKFRLQYWSGTLEIIKEFPILGTGPGNFRQHYLRYKLPESSEEIADPHNFVFDVWTSGGLLGLLGMFGVIVAGARTFWRATGTEAATPLPLPQTAPLRSDPFVVGATLAFVLWLCIEYVLGADVGVDFGLTCGWLAAVAVLRPVGYLGSVGTAALAAGAAALLIHLLGAGGIEMPAIPQVLLLLPALAAVARRDGEEDTTGSGPRLLLGTATAAVVLFVTCLLTATMPVLNRSSLVEAGDAALLLDGNAREAESLYAEAAAADPLSAEPVERLGNLTWQRWQAAPAGEEARLFKQMVELVQRAIALDPHSPNGYRLLGERWLARFGRTGNRKHAAAAAEAFAEAVARYPHNAALRVQMARALHGTGEPEKAIVYLREAIRLDAINRAEGHRDKVLPFETNGSRLLGEWRLEAFAESGDKADALVAAEAFSAAAELFPENPTLNARWAEALAAAGNEDEAAAKAIEALRLDDKAEDGARGGDRLGDEERERMNALARG